MTSRTLPKTIVLGGDPIYAEAPAGGAITPGMFLDLASTGKVAAHAVEGGPTNYVAREMEIVGGSIDDAYEADDTVLFCKARKGDRFYALLAAGEDVAIGDLLESDGAGALQAVTPGSQDGETPFAVVFPGTPIARALEAVDNDPGTGGAAVRIKVEIV